MISRDSVIIIFGPQGLLGTSLSRAFRVAFPDSKIIEISRQTGLIQNFFHLPAKEKNFIDPCKEVFSFYCHGPTDPNLEQIVFRKFQLDLPLKWFKWLRDHCNLKSYITFGSVHECVAELCDQNHYLMAKREFAEQIFNEKGPSCHLRLHTLYGLPVKTNSFIGQLFRAFRERRDFEMTTGHQIREYHHVDDLADLVVNLSRSTFANLPKVSDINHGQPLSLKDLASRLNERLGNPIELRMKIPMPRGEVLKPFWPQTPKPFTPLTRDPIESLAQLYLQHLKKFEYRRSDFRPHLARPYGCRE